MATKTLSPLPQPLYSFPFPSKFRTSHHLHHPWPPRVSTPPHGYRVAARLSLHQTIVSSSALTDNLQHDLQNPDSMFFLADTAGYSLSSYYTSLGLFVISVPGLWSLIKRSVKSKIVQKTFVGEGAEEKAPNQVAAEILSFFTRSNFVVTDRGETITFEGMMVPSRGQAALLTFCTCISLASVALVLTITFPDVGNNWFWITVLSPLAGAYYWKRASRNEQIKVKMLVADDGTVSEVVVQGDDQQVDQMRKELKLSEKGMVYVKGLFER
ncbi:Cofactor assembly of complex C isoform 2 [Hibiscus syriacus]|uniref:Cofactor assembly of complex C isoform 2 n=1 Tax=Hibiscus syriacus TaxID=106335 RepID=A0A6A2WWI7_HIBSY|nr:protein COFACTOR ASSEMBLY OF COMPLEX C SUBUNIT B CCB1, chloroplastic-like [Hibiscus syriacus]KAE8665691.1 Cofactor assembly of complex C isoform 2 [Hibiscus syriacus]